MRVALAAHEAVFPDLDASLDPGPPPGRWLRDFDARTHLGRKGVRSLSRSAALFLAACEPMRARASELWPDPDRTGVILGTTLGSFASMSDYTRETLVEKERPFLVNPSLFPATVMNFVAGQVAIRYGLRGANSTLAGGPLALVVALDAARRAFRSGQVDALVVGCVEEYSVAEGWAAVRRGAPPHSEGAVAFAMRPAEGRDATVLHAVHLGFEAEDRCRARRLVELVERCVEAHGPPRALLCSGPAAVAAAVQDACAGVPIVGLPDGSWGAVGLALQLHLALQGGDGGLLLAGSTARGSLGVAWVEHRCRP